MYFTSLLATTASLATIGSAAVIPKEVTASAADAYVGDLRTYTQFGCDVDNQGVGTFTHSMTSSCNVYAESFASLYIHMGPGWQFRAHMKADCSDEGLVIDSTTNAALAPIVCNNQTSEKGPWVAYSVYPVTA
ncbi:hypothetical protein F4821DRAFT_264498 [Hypoxylon rubiginosum]|uniref:Uncharacterized protein n=1 Tax=Hypoxylon rubiginosum TaxID=110542 RepID=A0ACC0CN64_9PEZI|nr:hypothetical protein F4821DRAFT_264498 [Hypoxylon rubiginosum]